MSGLALPTRLLWVGLPLLVGVVFLNLGLGAATLPWSELPSALGLPVGTQASPGTIAILWAVRAPRVGLGLLVGAALAVGGALLQAVFRNPLADPGVLGVSGGAAVGAALVSVGGGALVLTLPNGWLWAPAGLSIGAFVGAFGAAWLVRLLGAGGSLRLILAGVVVSSLCGAVLSLTLWIADDAALRSINLWMMGSLGGATGPVVLAAAAWVGLPLVLALRLARRLDVLQLGETEAIHLGVDPERLRRHTLILVVWMVGTAVSLSGTIGFVGLVVPQLVRLLWGGAQRVVLVGSLVGGPTLLLAADLAARTLATPAEVPIGVLTALIGAPMFGWLLSRETT